MSIKQQSLSFTNCHIRFYCRRRERHGRDKATEDVLHSVPDPRAGEGIPFQPVPHTQEEDRNRSRPLPLREADQDLVPEPEDEVEKGAQAGFNDASADTPGDGGSSPPPSPPASPPRSPPPR
ncbi:uncharacterized protein TNIN_78691 [Trichonephila inaurata madagascariensis]|uniref:Uncharacterized protein n=1 Tax=Trichonephila inaurata madagascariensis TaxID=2747483 RepID=A0A8X6XLM9_9ARAC|nr:uncharacterized protein TNIN_78691 [Trichonephila inaurata madagascariensis]